MKFRLEILNNIKDLVKELSVGLRKLTFSENFDSFEWSGTLTSSVTNYAIRHSLTTIPTKYIIVRQTGNAIVTSGSTEWDGNFVYMTNNTATNAIVTIIFFK